ncbi:hypothetical protein MKW98_006461 [Papaver atlanticum]|uniref:Uncharacterized protein n=1 Tax=Papaver atlanticum TaxID=357466 RepID=A0AAD4SIL2_9MAGN|nr:hypothetical protein MKW98_006461 [Papaver atlanticum]
MDERNARKWEGPEPLIAPAGARVLSLTDCLSKMSRSDPSDQSQRNLLDPKDIKRCETDSLPGFTYFYQAFILSIHPQFTYGRNGMGTLWAGEFTEFALVGANGIFTGFTTEFVARAWDLEEDEVKELVGSQKSTGIIKVKDGFKMPELNDGDMKGMALNCLEAPLDVDIKSGGHVVVLNTKNLPLVEQVGLGADLVRIDAGSMWILL